MKGVNKGLRMGNMKKLFKLILLIILISPSSAYALSCSYPMKIIVAECANHTCTKGFRIDVNFYEKGGCHPSYRIIEAATEYELELLSLRINWKKNEDQHGVFQLGEGRYINEGIIVLDAQNLDEARRSWKYKVMLENLYLASWHVLDIFIALFCAALLTISSGNIKQKKAMKAYFQQLLIFVISIIPMFYLLGFYFYYWTAFFFVLIPLVWVISLVTVILKGLSSLVNKQ